MPFSLHSLWQKLTNRSRSADTEEMRWALVREANQDGVFDANLLTGETYYSPEWLANLGYLPGELPPTSETWHARIHPEDAKAVQSVLDDYLSGRIPKAKFEHRMLHRDGQWRWVQNRSQAVWDDSGRAIRLVGSHSDVTSRKQAEEERRQAEADLKLAHARLETLVEYSTGELRQKKLQWQALVEASPQMVWAASPEGLINYTSPRVTEYTGYSDLKGGDWIEVLHPADRTRTVEAWRAALETSAPYDTEFRIRSKDGEYRWFKNLAVAVRDAEGSVARWIGTSTDIENQKRNEENMETAVARRTAELAEARDRAEAATRSKSSFLAAMSHEIRTPMNGVIGMANLMLDTDLTSAQRCYMDTIRSSGESLLAVINDILDLSKIEAGRLALERAQFDLSTLVEEVCEVVATQAASKNVRLSCHVERPVPLDLIGDPVRLRQVVLNLLSNAVKFTSEGEVSLSVSREANRNDFTMLRFAIKDTGIGLSKKQQEGLFQSFHQGDASTYRRFGGTGLGLAISKSLVEMMGGSIGVHSQPGAGSTFWFNVCVEVAPRFAFAENLAEKNIGLVSDRPGHLSQLCSHLQGAGLSVSPLTPSSQAEWQRFDLLLLDSAIALPQMWSNLGAQVIVLGSKNDFEEPPPGALDYVQKPIRRLPLLRAVEAALEGRTLGAAPVSPDTASQTAERGHVLIAEDNKVNQLVARLMLEKLNCRVDIVEDGVAACAAVQRGSYSVILMDCQMPIMSGFEATERIRAFQTAGRRTPIIALTAGVLQEERERCYASGMDDFLSKPISAKQLEEALDKWIPAGSMMVP